MTTATALKTFDVRDVPKATDAQLAVVENPRHRHILKNFRRHGLLEVSGLWQQILVPEMTVEHPVYRLNDNGQRLALDGMEAVAGFYKSVADAGENVFGPLEEQIAVTDYGIFAEALFAHILRGDHASLADEGTEPDKFYQVSAYISMAWPYAKGRLVGEHVYEDAGSRTIVEVPASAVQSPADARALLAPEIAKVPLEDIVTGLVLFEND